MAANETREGLKKMDDNIKHLSIKGVKWSALDGFITRGITFVIGLVIARILSPDDYGTIGMLAIFMAVSQMFINSGFSTALIRMTDRTADDYATAFYFNMAVGGLLYGILFLAAPAIASFYKMPILTDVLRLFALTLVISALQIVPRTKLVVAVDFKSQAIVSAFAALVSGGTGIGMAYTGYGLWALVWQSIISALVSVILLWIVTGWKPWEGRFARRSFHRLFSFGSKLLASGLLHILYKNLSSLVIGKFYTSADLGYYSRGQQISEVPSLYFSSIFQRVSYPILARLQDDNEHLSNAYRRYLGMSSMVIFFLMVLLATIAEPLVRVLLTEKWMGAVPFLRIFCLALIFDHICCFNNNMMYVKGRSDLFLRLEIIKKIIVFPLLLLAIPHGVIAICFVPVVHELVDLVIGTYCVKRFLGVHNANPLKDYGKYLFYSLPACIPAFFICNTNISPWLSMSTSIVFSITLYLGILWRDDNMRELTKLLKSV
jgi:O-antigen/teichoic acid export membrane protein